MSVIGSFLKEFSFASEEREKIKTIYHISDIHISQNNNRYEEYRTVFNRLVEQLEKDSKNSILYIGGDIVHEKGALWPLT